MQKVEEKREINITDNLRKKREREREKEKNIKKL